MQRNLLRCLMMSLCFCALVATGMRACADSYVWSYVGSGNGTTIAGIDDYGDYIIGHPFGGAGCTTAFTGCYETFYAATGLKTWTNTLPMLLTDLTPIAGSGCTYTGPSATSVCNNGHQVVSAVTSPFSVSSITSQGYTSIYSGTMDASRMSANGNLLFVDGSKDLIVLGINQSAVPLAASIVTSEPSSIALVGTGVLGIIGVIRRRFA